MAAALVVVVLFAFALLRSSSGQSPTSSLVTGAQVPSSWVTYRDPAGYFTIRVPPTWRATVGTGTGTYGDRTGSYSFTDENVDLGTGSNFWQSVGISIYVEPISSAFARHWNCTANAGALNATIAGLPATDLGWTWLLNTEDAHFQISTPLTPNPGGPMITTPPTPVPQATIVAEQHLYTQVIATFRPIPDTPLKCS
jgi:hypothetical protein